jgi:hypothetical protein
LKLTGHNEQNKRKNITAEQNTEKLPEQWKDYTIVPIYKKGKMLTVIIIEKLAKYPHITTGKFNKSLHFLISLSCPKAYYRLDHPACMPH